MLRKMSPNEILFKYLGRTNNPPPPWEQGENAISFCTIPKAQLEKKIPLLLLFFL